jgi:hypothetical protein
MKLRIFAGSEAKATDMQPWELRKTGMSKKRKFGFSSIVAMISIVFSQSPYAATTSPDKANAGTLEDRHP